MRVDRPKPAGYFLDAQSGSGLLSWEHVDAALAEARNYWVATAGPRPHCVPHCMPVWGIWDAEPREFTFSTGPTTRKARNLDANPYAVVHLESGDRVVVVEGPAREIREPDALERWRGVYNAKYEWDFTLDQLTPGGVWAVRVVRAFAWLGSEGESFSGTATRWVFDD